MKRVSKRRLIYLTFFLVSSVGQLYVNIELYERARRAETALNLIGNYLGDFLLKVNLMEETVLSHDEVLKAHLNGGKEE